jgi:hypothetical protein
MKNSKEKALELCMYFQNLLFINLTDETFIHSDSKKCAMKCIEEIQDSMPIAESLNYYRNVREEIKKL